MIQIRGVLGSEPEILKESGTGNGNTQNFDKNQTKEPPPSATAVRSRHFSF
jgi:hypothetical protein